MVEYYKLGLLREEKSGAMWTEDMYLELNHTKSGLMAHVPGMSGLNIVKASLEKVTEEEAVEALR